MSFRYFKDLCEYYLDCILEDNTDSISAFYESRNSSYVKINSPDLTSREHLILFENERNSLRQVYQNQTRGNQRKNWFYGFPLSHRYITSNSGWQGGIIQPVFFIQVEIDNLLQLRINSNIPKINIDALKWWDIELQEARAFAENIGLFGDSENTITLQQLGNLFINNYPNLPINDNPNKTDSIIFGGAIFAAEGSPYTAGLEAELNKLKWTKADIHRKTSLKVYFQDSNEIIIKPKKKTKEIEKEITEVYRLNDLQKEVVKSAFKNDLTVVTGPPGTGKSQVVASIILNAAKNGERVLFASKNHKAVDVVESRLNEFANRPFIIRLGRRGSVERDIQGELINYLTGLIGATSNEETLLELEKIKNEISVLKNKRIEIQNRIEQYRINRNKVNELNSELLKLSEKYSDLLIKKNIEWAKENNFSFINIFKLLSPIKRKTKKYIRNLENINNIDDFETLCERYDSIENIIQEKSEKEFNLWLDSFPSRIDNEKRKMLAKFLNVIQQIASAGNDTPKNVWANLYSQRENIMKAVTGFLPAWCVTNLSAKGYLPLVEGFFDLIVIDEASQCDIPSAIPLLFRAKRAVIIGDPNQLQHITSMSIGRSLTLMSNHNIQNTDLSIFEYTNNSLFRVSVGRIGEGSITMLKEHFRSHKDIIEFSNQKWYNNSLTIDTDYRRLLSDYNNNEAGVLWENISGVILQEKGSGAFINEEINAVVDKVVSIVRSDNFKGNIGVVTPFRLQANKIREKLIKELSPDEWKKTNLLVDTTVKFQGDEKDIIIFSPVVSDIMPKGVRYYHESTPHLFNVSITRARTKLIVIGNFNACLHCGISLIRDFAQYVNSLSVKIDNKDIQENIFESPYEKILFEELQKNSINAIPQYSLNQYRLDFAIIENNKKINIEVDGKKYHLDWDGIQLKKDMIRNLSLQKLGWKVLRFWSYEIRDNMEYCISRIKNELN